MSVLWAKLWFDLWHQKARTVLVVTSVAAGVFAVGGIFGMSDQLIDGMDESHRKTQPSHINMFLQHAVGLANAEQLAKLPGVEGVDLGNQISVRYKMQQAAEWRGGNIVTRSDYAHQTYDVVTLKAGSWPTRNTIGVERLTAQYFGLKVGDTVLLEMPDETARPFQITGLMRQPLVEPPQFGGDAVFFMDNQGLERLGIPDGRYFNLKARTLPYSEDNARAAATQIKDRLAKDRVSVAATLFQGPTEHWARPLVEGVQLVLEVLAVVSLLMSVVLVTNTVTAIITEQTNQIGILKAIGGTRRVIGRLYLAGVAFYGVLAFFISVPLGALLAFGASRWFLNMFNIEHEIFELSRRAFGFQVMAALAVPLLAALPPVLRGVAITVRQALASYGLGTGQFGRGRFEQALERAGLGRLPAAPALALGNMFRRKERLLLTQVVLIAAGAMFISVLSLNESLIFTLDTDLARRAYNIRFVFVREERVNRVLPLVNAMPEVAAAELWYVHPVSVLRAGQRAREVGSGAQIIGVPFGSDMYVPRVLEGRWLANRAANEIMISREMADENGLRVGDEVSLDMGEFGASAWSVAGIFKVAHRKVGDPDPVYAPADAVKAATKKFEQGSRLLVRTRSQSAADVDAVYRRINDALEARQVIVSTFGSATTAEDKVFALGQFSVVTALLLVVAVVVAVVGGLGLMGSLAISVVERTREVGVMRAVGARSRTIMVMFFLEGVLQAAVSWLLAVPLAFVVARPFARALGQVMLKMDLDFKFAFSAAGIWLVCVLVIAVLASAMPAQRAARIRVSESLAYA
jgi:putative ABC transport system permease protein